MMRTEANRSIVVLAFLLLAVPSSAPAKTPSRRAKPTHVSAAGQSLAPPAPPASAPDTASALPAGTELPVGPVPPEQDKEKEDVPTLHFLRGNLDFIHAQSERARDRSLERRAAARDLDPRLLEHSRQLAEALASRDTLSAADDRSRQHLLESIAELSSLESQLDLLEHHLEMQRTRLAYLEDNFTGQQQTSLMVLLSGYPKALPVTEVTISFEAGEPVRVELSPEQCESLRHGGVVELFHGHAEPRAQVVQVSLGINRLSSGEPGFVTLNPMRDRLMFLRFDLSNVQPAQGGAGIRASTWFHEAGAHSVDG